MSQEKKKSITLQVRCPECGTLNDEDAKRCKKCGHSLAEKKRCPECGAMCDEDAAVCYKCGYRFH